MVSSHFLTGVECAKMEAVTHHQPEAGGDRNECYNRGAGFGKEYISHCGA